jgi:hypothetical protein
MEQTTTFVVGRGDLERYRFDTAAAGAVDDGEVVVKIDRFSFTANNITYAETGDVLRYWQFFPAPDSWGVIPVWGFGDVVESRHPAVARGERLFGFWPMATHVRLRPERVDGELVVDGSPHRGELAGTYNAYSRCAGDPLYDPRHEDLQSLFRGLFGTGFLIDDFLADREFFQARTVVISSASSKTAYSLAHQLHRRGGIEVVGLTSPSNRALVAAMAVYDRVLTYDELSQLDPQVPAVFVDFAGSGAVRTAIHQQLGDKLAYSMAVGMSHRDLHPPGKGLPGPRPVFFFAPERRRQRNQDWGRDGFAQRIGGEWRALLSSVERWLKVTRGSGRQAVEQTYLDTLHNKVAPDRGHILSL